MKKILKYGCFSFLLITLLVTISGILLLWLSYDTGTNITPIQKELLAKQNIIVLDLQKKSNIQIAQINRVDSSSINIIAFHDVYRDSLIQINEVSEEGHVNKILLKNNSDKYVFIMDGDIILGAKQNRVFNTSMLIGPNKEYYLSVSCIEKNRWQKK